MSHVFKADVLETDLSGASARSRASRVQMRELCRGISSPISCAGMRNPTPLRGVILGRFAPQEGSMAAFDGDNDLGPIVVAVVLGTLVAGAFIFGWN